MEAEIQPIKVFAQNDQYTLYQGSMLEICDVLDPNSVDSVVTDPPYELNFMGNGWDNSGIAFQPNTWKQCYTVLKPGGYLLAFGGSRTFHRIACAIEDAGFEIRDTIMWLYGSGFPKSMNIGLMIDKKNGVDNRTGATVTTGSHTGSIVTTGTGSLKKEYEERHAQNEWAGWGTALKPAYEPVIVARKPLEGSCVDNVLKYGVGGINIDDCRVGDIGGVHKTNIVENSGSVNCGFGCNGDIEPLDAGRFPSNVILTYDETDQNEVCGGMPYTENITKSHTSPNSISSIPFNTSQTINIIGYEDSGSASRYFYCAKASKRDRDEGLEKFNAVAGGSYEFRQDGSLDGGIPERRNIHPTVKPVDLMQYLIRLVTPKGGTVLDPFNGSGSTGKAAMYENKDRNSGYKYIGVELTPEYLPIAQSRIQFAIDTKDTVISGAKKAVTNQISLFNIE